jgi:hypothetical protein
MSCNGTATCACGCCAGTSVQTPQFERNRPGLNALAYRVGACASFKESMLARLSSSDYPALQALKTRSDDDFTVASLDATSIVLDILTFYQERLVNESYLRTATQVRSLTELSRLIGYQPAPGVAASTYLTFSLKQATAQPPDPTAPPITIPKGTQAQSVPAQGRKPQTFETSADIQAKPDWNALLVRTGSPWAPASGDLSLYLSGTATQLQPGDLFLIVGDERAGSSASENWDVRVVATVTVDGPNNRTYITWNEGLGGGSIAPAKQNPKFYAFRQRTALFGYNALQTILIDQTHLTSIAGLLNSAKTDWDFTNSQSSANKELYKSQLIDLDGAYSKIVPHGWIALIDGSRGQGVAGRDRIRAGRVHEYGFGAVSAHLIQLQGNLINCYDRAATSVNANVGMATAGQSITEVMGNGNASAVDQKFTLRQSPLTYIQARRPPGCNRRCKCASTASHPGRRRRHRG